MILKDKTFILEITDKEAKELADVLNTAYKALREEYETKNDQMAATRYHQMESAREFRNMIAGLINLRYCGIDA